ncbi:MAG: ATP-binding protein, partial [Mariprofundaceae bacterium]
GSVDMLRQVLVNLLLNAIDASPEGASVRIDVDHDERCVVLDVSDQGCGIDPEHVEAIFSPMFSTKQKGQGTGLGLSISRDLIQQMHGDLTLAANGADGCTFRISLPMTDAGGEHADTDH